MAFYRFSSENIITNEAAHFNRVRVPSPAELRQPHDTVMARIMRTLVLGGVLAGQAEQPDLG